MPRRVVSGLLLVLMTLCAAPAFAGPVLRVPLVQFGSGANFSAVEGDAQGSPPPVPAFEYSEAYRVRARVHRIASMATLPLFGVEAFLGQSLYTNPTDSKRSAHLAVAGAIGGLFAVNTVTGVWNLIEARKDPVGRKRRLVHGILMLAADGGFLATAAMGPEREHGFAEGSAGAHRAMAFTAIGAATAGYLVMLVGGH